jgi:hypothetical protein
MAQHYSYFPEDGIQNSHLCDNLRYQSVVTFGYSLCLLCTPHYLLATCGWVSFHRHFNWGGQSFYSFIFNVVVNLYLYL